MITKAKEKLENDTERIFYSNAATTGASLGLTATGAALGAIGGPGGALFGAGVGLVVRCISSIFIDD